MIYVVGIGPGHRDYILPKAIKVMESCDLIIGFKRAVDSLDFINTPKTYMTKLSDLDNYILKGDKYNSDYVVEAYKIQTIDKYSKNIAIIASGDPTFYGITNYIKKKAEVDFQVIPGISSFQYLTSKSKLPWNNAYLGSLHGRKEEFLENVINNELSIWLTDKENTPKELCKILNSAKINCRVIIGENLSYEDEVISEGIPKEFIYKDFSELNIFIVNNLDS